MTTQVTHVTVRDDGPPNHGPQRIGAIYAIPGPEFKTYVPNYARRDEDETAEDSEVQTKVVTAGRRPARPKANTAAETKSGRKRPSAINHDEA